MLDTRIYLSYSSCINHLYHSQVAPIGPKRKIYETYIWYGHTTFFTTTITPFSNFCVIYLHHDNTLIYNLLKKPWPLFFIEVLHPMGFDAFGLPAENAAFQQKVDPAEWTYNNIRTMKKELQGLGFSYDWDREIITSSDSYYKFTQYLFLLLFKAGLAYQKEVTTSV